MVTNEIRLKRSGAGEACKQETPTPSSSTATEEVTTLIIDYRGKQSIFSLSQDTEKGRSPRRDLYSWVVLSV